ncbi:MAG TPA: non-canonical purine NTP pyrophosphatase [Sphaerochaeta sp.]|nr:non-canonical purine NTP pyrophosphatase [Sphaerochaeta sp.]
MKILLASSNVHKKEEFAHLLPSYTLALPTELGISFDFIEDRETFTENAFDKAMALAAVAPPGWSVLADDSGLCVDALGGGPGVRTARYGMEAKGRLLSSAERNAYLLENLAHLQREEERRAYFVCALALVLSPRQIYTVSEEVAGSIAFASEGSGGFGYDPIFIVTEAGLTMASLSEAQKNRYSHRARATQRLLQLLEE